MTWHFGTKKRRLNKKIIELESKLSKIEIYSSQTGYKSLINDSFFIFSYVGGVVLIALGINSFLLYFPSVVNYTKFLSLFISGVYLGAGMILIEHFLLLGKVSNPNKSIKSMKEKIENLNSKNNDN